MKIIIKDVKMIIDLFNMGLLSFCKELKIEFHTTRFVVAEIMDSKHSAMLIDMIKSRLLVIDDFAGKEYDKLIEFIAECNGENNLSEADCSVLLLAKRHRCRLLTSDRKLMRKAEEQGIEVNGLICHIHFNHLNRHLETKPRALENEVVKRIDNYKNIINDIQINLYR